MASFGQYLASVAAPITQRAVAGLGFGVITYSGFDLAFNQLQTAVQANMAGIFPPIASLLYLAGFNQALSIVLGAAGMRATMMVTKRLGLL